MSHKEVFDCIQVINDFPKKGIMFRHIGPLLNNPKLFKFAMNELYQKSTKKFDVVCGLDARGFILATAFQDLTNLPQVMIRKGSKLPGNKYTYEYKKEYGSDTFELEHDYIKKNQRVLIIDDLVATGGSLIAAVDLIHQAGGIVSDIVSLIEFKDLGAYNNLKKICPNANIYSYISVNSYNNEYIQEVKISEYLPTIYPFKDNLPVLMWHHTMKTFAEDLFKVSNFRPSNINWDKFPDDWLNITFEPSVTLINKNVTFIMNLSNKEIFAEQLCLLVALPRQLIQSLTVVIPYLGPATHERVDYSGQLATVEPLLKIMSSSIPMTKSGPAIFRIIDIHALQIRFYTNDQVTMKLMSAIPVLLEFLKTKKDYAIAFPDDGAYKRFKYYFNDFPQIICSKIRDGESRKIIIREKMNWPVIKTIENVLIVDDLVQSGETLLKCAEALKGFGFKTTDVYATHAVFPNESYKKFINSNIINNFILTNTNPSVTDKLKDVSPFIILNVQSHLCSELGLNDNSIESDDYSKHIKIYVASTNSAKLGAVYESISESNIFPSDSYFQVFSVSGINSGVPEQPYTIDEIIEGAMNRINHMINEIGEEAIYISIENGIYKSNDNYYDTPVLAYKILDKEIIVNYGDGILIPVEYNKYVEESLVDQKKTFGSIIEKQLAIKDWHKYVCGISRKDLIKDLIINI